MLWTQALITGNKRVWYLMSHEIPAILLSNTIKKLEIQKNPSVIPDIIRKVGNFSRASDTQVSSQNLYLPSYFKDLSYQNEVNTTLSEYYH